ncbi:hypothetical protein JOD82_001971 [Paenibacillus sp. 1182]|uniref:hypothetical protein n=1 Tax=Paenibacillus sp. 1182 TaxID=2806565 RepID=UPI001B425C91|nr:hypothetical protein [Paenibacillus sp. 1182]MBP1308951.1 hypothetical protein [Paenibacillus sp. 1182]
MGSGSRESAIFKFVQTFGERFNTHFKSLVGLQVECLKEVKVDYYVKGVVKLSNESELPVHYRWSSQEDDDEGKELDEDFVKINDYFTNCVIGKTITSVELGYADRDDEVYLICKLNNETRFHFEIPMGFDPEILEIDSFASQLITEDEFNAFIE